MKKRSNNKVRKICEAAIAISICLAFIMPGSAVITHMEKDKLFGGTLLQEDSRSDAIFASSRDCDCVTITVQSTEEVTRLTYHISAFTGKQVSINGREYFRVVLGKESNIMKKGMPDLPNICRSLIIPDDAKMDIRVVNADYEDYEDILIAPSKGFIPRSVNPADVPYEFDKVYERDDWFPKDLAELVEPYILRDFRGQVVQVNPFQYNPVARKLRVYKDITVEVFSVGPGEINVFNREKPLDALDTDFKSIYERHFLNFNSGGGRYTPVEEQGNMLVITYDSFWDEMTPFVEWKNMKGIPTEMVNISDIGSTATAIKNYIVNHYTTNGLTFVLLVGDIQQLPSFTAQDPYKSEVGSSDPTYSYIVGGDHYPDLFVGRFSAQTSAQVETQVQRTLDHEAALSTIGSWYRKGTGIASDDGSGFGDDYEWDWEHLRYIRTDLLSYGYTEVDELYEGNQGGEDARGDPTSSMVSTALNNGRGIVNYCGHGTRDHWSTTGFDVGDVNALTNDDMLPFIWSLACLVGAFEDMNACFAEAWLRATQGGEPAGAVAAFMSSVRQHWDPPMDAQDEMVDLLVNDEKVTFGGLCFNGCMHMNDEYGSSGYEMTDTWHVFGDPSLQIRTDPDPMVYVNDDAPNDPGPNDPDVSDPLEDGSWEHPFDMIQEGIGAAVEGDTVFVLEGTYYENVVVDKSINLTGENKDSTVIDGSGVGTVLDISADWVNVSGFTIQNGNRGINVDSNHCSISDNSLLNNYEGIWFNSSNNNTIVGNTIISNSGSYGYGICLYEASSDSIISGNTVSGYSEGISNLGAWRRNITISENTIMDNGDGIYLSFISSSNIIGNNIFGNKANGIWLGTCADENTISGNTISNTINGNGIYLSFSDQNRVFDNIIECNYVHGIKMEGSDDNQLYQNVIRDNDRGYGILMLGGSDDNRIYHNNFVNNHPHAYDECTNTWYSTTLQKGNYWDDYADLYPPVDVEPPYGIWDTPYAIPPGGDNQDNYPLKNPWKPPSGHPGHPCFLPGTAITLANGNKKPIETIRIGEQVLGYDEQFGAVVSARVLQTFVHHNIPTYYVLTLEDGRTLQITGNHPIYNGVQYVEVHDFRIGDHVSILSEDNTLETLTVSDITIINGSVSVYNLEVAQTHNYFAAGCLVHNKNPPVIPVSPD